MKPDDITADYEMGGTWGDCIAWNGTEQFADKMITEDSTFDCHGWKRVHPQAGQTLLAEFQKSWIVFEFVSVRSCSDPRDMFFATVKPVSQRLK